MLPKVNLLRKEKDFEAVFERNKAYYGTNLGMKVRKNSNETKRFGFLVGTKVSKLATRRNLIKRRLKYAVLQQLDQIKGGQDFVIITFPSILGKNYQEIKSELEEGLISLKAKM